MFASNPKILVVKAPLEQQEFRKKSISKVHREQKNDAI